VFVVFVFVEVVFVVFVFVVVVVSGVCSVTLRVPEH
jgi:hypothetical protein